MAYSLRRAAFAGSWYPARAAECEAEINAFIERSRIPPPLNPHPVGGILPHAGWYFSGAISCNVIHRLKEPGNPPPDVIVLFGMHLRSSSPNILMVSGAWETPFGDLPVAEELASEMARQFPFQIETPDRHTPDNTIELQLPFIKYFFPEAKILAMGVPPVEATLQIGRSVVETARRLQQTLKVIGSTDLTHYGPNYGFTAHGGGPSAVSWVKQENDRRIIEAMLELDARRLITEALENQNACCPGAAAAAIEAGRHLGAKSAETVSYTTSYDRSPGASFVGYVGVLF
jgi:MEMO1 family protein